MKRLPSSLSLGAPCRRPSSSRPRLRPAPAARLSPSPPPNRRSSCSMPTLPRSPRRPPAVKEPITAPPSPRAHGPATHVTLLPLTLMPRGRCKARVPVDAMLHNLPPLMSSGSAMPTASVLGPTSTTRARLMLRLLRTLLLLRQSPTSASRMPLPRLLTRSVSLMLATNLAVSSPVLLRSTREVRRPILLL